MIFARQGSRCCRDIILEDQVEKTEQENTLKYEADNVTTLATTVYALVKKQNYKVEQKLNISTKPRSSTPVGTSHPPFAMSAMSPIALQKSLNLLQLLFNNTLLLICPCQFFICFVLMFSTYGQSGTWLQKGLF
jgi:hypothetical protein